MDGLGLCGLFGGVAYLLAVLSSVVVPSVVLGTHPTLDGDGSSLQVLDARCDVKCFGRCGVCDAFACHDVFCWRLCLSFIQTWGGTTYGMVRWCQGDVPGDVVMWSLSRSGRSSF
jgi:hypothetical protein